VTRLGEHDLLWRAQGGRRGRRLRQGQYLPLIPPTRPPLRPGAPQKVRLSNARVQLFAPALNNLGVGAIHAGIVAPLVNGRVSDPRYIYRSLAELRRRSALAGASLAREASHASIETYWLVVPLVGIVLAVPVCAWLTGDRSPHTPTAHPYRGQ